MAVDASANLIQLLHLRAEDKPCVLQWLDKSANKHTAPENQNEMLELMAHHVVRKILESIHTSPFLAVMIDETTDTSNKEQLTLVVRWVSEDFSVRRVPGSCTTFLQQMHRVLCLS